MSDIIKNTKIHFKVCKKRIIIYTLNRRNYWDTSFDIPEKYRGVYTLTKSFSWEIDNTSWEFLLSIEKHCVKLSDKEVKQWMLQSKQEKTCL